MPLLYDFNMDTADELAAHLSENVKHRRLEKGLSRSALSMMSGVPKSLLAEPVYTTMEELDTINKNKNRKRGRNEFHQ